MSKCTCNLIYEQHYASCPLSQPAPPAPQGPREWWIEISPEYDEPRARMTSQLFADGHQIHVIEKSIYDAVVKELALSDELAHKWQTLYGEATKKRDELKAKHSIEIMTIRNIAAESDRSKEQQLASALAAIGHLRAAVNYVLRLYDSDPPVGSDEPDIAACRHALAATSGYEEEK
jgi:hypothetical protein